MFIHCVHLHSFVHTGKATCSGDVLVYIVCVLLLVPSLSFLCVTSSSPVAPNVTNISEDQTVTSPAPVSFNCIVDSYPPSNITWFHNGAELQEAPPRVTISTVPVDNRTQESTLTFLNTTAENIGTYTCSAVNGEALTDTTTELQVLGEWGSTKWASQIVGHSACPPFSPLLRETEFISTLQLQ